MTKTILVMLGMLLGMAACDGGMPPLPPPKTAANVRSTGNSDEDDIGTRAKAILDRAKTAIDMAENATRKDGSRETARAYGEYVSCTDDACAEKAKKDPRQVGALAGLAVAEASRASKARNADAVIAAEPHVTRGEALAEMAKQAAEKEVAERTKAEKTAADDDKATDEAANACDDHDLKWCMKQCDDGKAPFCWVVSAHYIASKEFEKAKPLMKRACDAGFEKGCVGVKGIPKLESAANIAKNHAAEERAATVDAAFSDVASVVDDIAAKVFIANTAAKMGGRAARQVPRMRLVIDADVKERFCPARKEAIAAMGARDFAARAAKHCKEEPPTAQGLSGAQVDLPNECTQVFASSCP